MRKDGRNSDPNGTNWVKTCFQSCDYASVMKILRRVASFALIIFIIPTVKTSITHWANKAKN